MAARRAARTVHEIFVAKLPWTAGTSEIREYFSQFGTVRTCRLNYDQKTGFSKGFAFVGFLSEDGVQKVFKKDHHVIDGQKIAIKPRQDSPTFYNTNKLQINDIFDEDTE